MTVTHFSECCSALRNVLSLGCSIIVHHWFLALYNDCSCLLISAILCVMPDVLAPHEQLDMLVRLVLENNFSVFLAPRGSRTHKGNKHNSCMTHDNENV